MLSGYDKFFQQDSLQQLNAKYSLLLQQPLTHLDIFDSAFLSGVEERAIELIEKELSTIYNPSDKLHYLNSISTLNICQVQPKVEVDGVEITHTKVSEKIANWKDELLNQMNLTNNNNSSPNPANNK